MNFKDHVFTENDIVELDGNSYEGCTFRGCQVVFRAKGESVGISGCTFHSVTWVLLGNARLTLDMLRGIAEMGTAHGNAFLVNTFPSLKAWIKPEHEPELALMVEGKVVGSGPIYRYFEKPEHAEALIRGEVWVSTLEDCRIKEDPARADVGEGTMTYNTGAIHGPASNPDVQTVARRMRMDIDPTQVVVSITNSRDRQTLRDAYVLCTTERGPDDRLEKMGPHCVRIANAQDFFRLTTKAMQEQREIASGAMDFVKYRPRSYQGTEPLPGHIGFIKPPDKYAEEREIRLLWEPVRTDTRLQPFPLHCPAVAALCSHVD